jgi:hypothetical protein
MSPPPPSPPVDRMPLLLRGNARHLPLPAASVDCIVTSPPFYALRSYRDGGEHISGQIGAEATPRDYLDALLEVTAECVRVLKPGEACSSTWATSTPSAAPRRDPVGSTTTRWCSAQRRARPGAAVATPRSSRCSCYPSGTASPSSTNSAWVVRAVVVWDKPNPMPESVTDRVARTHEDWVYITRSPRYYASVDEIREPHRMSPLRRPHGRPRDTTDRQGTSRQSWPTATRSEPGPDGHDLGRLPGSVWEILTQPLKLPPWLRHVEHRAAFANDMAATADQRLVLAGSVHRMRRARRRDAPARCCPGRRRRSRRRCGRCARCAHGRCPREPDRRRVGRSPR